MSGLRIAWDLLVFASIVFAVASGNGGQFDGYVWPAIALCFFIALRIQAYEGRSLR